MALRDVVEVLGQLIYRDQVRNEVFLLASGHSMPIGEIAELVQKSARDVLGIATSITQNLIDKEIPQAFTLEPRKFRDAGIVIPNSRDDEIRELLLVAEQHFGRVSS